MAGLVERSLRLVLDAAEGRDLHEMDDWKKEVSLLKNSLPQEDAVTAMRTIAVLLASKKRKERLLMLLFP